MVESQPSKLLVASSILVSRSNFPITYRFTFQAFTPIYSIRNSKRPLV